MGGGKQLIGALLIATALFLFWVFPYGEYTKISALKTALADRETLIKQRTDIQSQVKSLTTQYNQQSSAIQVLTAVVPTKKETAEIISAVQVMATQSGIQLGGINFTTGALQAERPYNVLSISMSGSGSYNSVRSFLDAMERNIRLMDVQNIKMSVDRQRGSIVDFDLQANVYFLK